VSPIGTELKQKGNMAGALAKYEEATAACPSYAPAFYNMGVIFSESQQVGTKDVPFVSSFRFRGTGLV
jgi:protein O-GlcNAc transferase